MARRGKGRRNRKAGLDWIPGQWRMKNQAQKQTHFLQDLSIVPGCLEYEVFDLLHFLLILKP
jgi:hypothetical protein